MDKTKMSIGESSRRREKFLLANICSEKFCESVSCSTAESDNFRAQNLLSGGQFMAERFVSSPVTLTFKFKQSLASCQILAIDIGLKIGNHRTNIVELYGTNIVKREPNPDEVLLRLGQGKFGKSVLRVRFVIKQMEYLLEQYSNEEMHETSFDQKCFMGNINQLKNTTIIALKIIHASHIRVVSSLKIWALIPQGALSLRHSEVSNNETVSKSNLSSTASSLNNKEFKGKILTRNSQKNFSEIQQVPEDFLDPLTLEPMVLPIMLPSGHNIDRSSLDKYLSREAEMGRSPSDPFTGVSFGAKVPIPNSVLKERMDKFWITHQDLAAQIKPGRTLCGGNDYTALTAPPTKRKAIQLDSEFGTPQSEVYSKKLRSSDSDLKAQFCDKVLNDKPSFL